MALKNIAIRELETAIAKTICDLVGSEASVVVTTLQDNCNSAEKSAGRERYSVTLAIATEPKDE